MKIVCYYIAVLATIAPWPETSAFTQRPTKYIGLYTTQSSSTYNPKGTPCEGVSCSWGKRCGVDENIEAACVCDASCNDDNYRVCGSDNKTYSSYCSLTKQACQTSSNVTISYYGQCTNEGSICNGIACSPNKVCAVAGSRAICVCNDNCPTYSNPVCGSDNQTYTNDCYLRRQSCLTNKNITIDYYNDCKQGTACDGFPCPNGTQCAVDERKNPVCICIDTCPTTSDLVCGTDGRTYGSECELYREACTSVTNIRIAYKGFCLEGSVCSGYRQCPKNRQCNVNQNNEPVCVCSQSCPPDFDPICGSDGVTYSNLCYLEMQACTTGTNLTMARKGHCIYNCSRCARTTCPTNQTCTVDIRNHRPRCVDCPSFCTKEYRPVCGCDGKTYGNPCVLQKAACDTGINIVMQYEGICNYNCSGCEEITCSSDKTCTVNTITEFGQCTDCPKTCPYNLDPVCGCDGKNYSTSCVLQMAACEAETYIVMKHKGYCEYTCDRCDAIRCRRSETCQVNANNQGGCVRCPDVCFKIYKPVCGCDGKTYGNECSLLQEACKGNRTFIPVKHNGECDNCTRCDSTTCRGGEICTVNKDNNAECRACPKRCPKVLDEVCGCDNKTYGNDCLLREAACKDKKHAVVKHKGRC